MGGLVKALFVLVLLAVPLLVIFSLPRLFDMAGSVSAGTTTVTSSSQQQFRLSDPTPTNERQRFAALELTPPPTLAPPATTATAVPTARPTPTGERIVIGNTGGIGAVLRSDPVDGRAVASLHEQQILEVLERRNVPGSGDWVHVRTAEGLEGWVIGVVALPTTPAQ